MKIFLPLAAALSLAACAAPTPPMTAAGPDFLTRNAAQKRVVTLPSGVQYFIIKRGPKGGVSPKEGDTVRFHYEGKLTNGTTFDSSIERGEPLEGKVGRFVKGFDEALTRMRPGDDWVVWIPPALGYGAKELPEIPANSVLRFRLQLLAVEPA